MTTSLQSVPEPKTIALVGFRATGKSTVGQLLGQELHWPWWDSDLEIERETGTSVTEGFSRHGEQWFRDVEEQVVRRLLQECPAVVSLGGGAISRPSTRALLKSLDSVVWLQSSPETIAARMQGDPNSVTRRPNLTGLPAMDEIRALLAARDPLYAEVSHLRYNTDTLSPACIVDQIRSRLAAG
jgi:shikimate kinase